MPAEATIEAPVTPPPAHPGSVTVDLANLGRKPVLPTVPATGNPITQEQIDGVEKPPVEKPPETPPVVPPVTKPAGDKEENMANLRKAREAAEAARKEIEAERDRLRTEFEEFRKKPPELPEEVKTRLTKAEELEKERAELQKTIRQLDLSRDPEFQAKYNRPIQERISTMGSTALAAGIPEADWKNAVANWDENQFAEWSEAMPAVQRVKFTAAWTAAVDLYQQQQSELQNADKSYAEMQKQRQTDAEAQQKQYIAQNEQLAKAVMVDFIKPETLKEYEDLAPAAEAMLMKAARHELPAKDIFTQIAANQVMARVIPKQDARIKELEATLAERDKKISEQDAFIANQAGAVPRGDAAGASGAVDDNTPLWGQIRVRT